MQCTLLNCYNSFILLWASPLKKTLHFLDRLQYKWIFEFPADKNRSIDSEYVETLSKRQSPTKFLLSTLVMIIFTQDYSILTSLQAITTKYYPQVASFLAWFVASLLVFPITRLKPPLWTDDKSRLSFTLKSGIIRRGFKEIGKNRGHSLKCTKNVFLRILIADDIFETRPIRARVFFFTSYE